MSGKNSAAEAIEPVRARSLIATATGARGPAIRELADELAFEALTHIGNVMRDETESDGARRGAARDIMYVWSRIPQLPSGDGGGLPDGLPVSPGERRDNFVALAKLRPPELMQALAEAGIVVQPQPKETEP